MDKPQSGAGVVKHHQHQFLMVKVHAHPSLSGRRWGCTPGHITVHPVVPDVKVGAGGGIRALGVDHELVRKTVLVQPGCGGQVVRPAFPIPGNLLLLMHKNNIYILLSPMTKVIGPFCLCF